MYLFGDQRHQLRISETSEIMKLRWLDQGVHVGHLWDAADCRGCEFSTLGNQHIDERTVVIIALLACH